MLKAKKVSRGLALGLLGIAALFAVLYAKSLLRWGRAAAYLAGAVPADVRVLARKPVLDLALNQEASVPIDESLGAWTHEVGEHLNRGGVHLVVLPIPTKEQWLTTDATSPEAAADFPPTTLLLQKRLWDLYAASPETRLYLPQDSLPTSFAVAHTALWTLEALRARGWVFPQFRVEAKPTVEDSPPNSLIKALQLPATFVNSRPEMQWQEPLYRLSSSRFRSQERVVLLADRVGGRLSGTENGLAALVGLALGREAIEVVTTETSADGPLWKAAQEGFSLRESDLVLWAFTTPQEQLPGERPPLPQIAPATRRKQTQTERRELSSHGLSPRKKSQRPRTP